MKGKLRNLAIAAILIGMIAFGGFILFNGLFPADPNAGLSPETLEQSEKYYEDMKQDERNDYLIDLRKGKVD